MEVERQMRLPNLQDWRVWRLLLGDRIRSHDGRSLAFAFATLLLFLASLNTFAQQQSLDTSAVEKTFSTLHSTLRNRADDILATVAQSSSQFTSQEGVSAESPILAAQIESVIVPNHRVQAALRRIQRLRPLLDPALQKEGIPPELTAVVLIESGGLPTALSPRGARGIWQLMPETARRYGLTVNSETDERLDVQKSTDAAVRYLSDLHEQFGDWPLALAAYNAGEKLVRNAVLRSKAKDFASLSGQHLLPAETKEYVPAILAATALFGRNSLTGSPTRQVHGGSSVLYAIASSGGSP